MIWDAQSEILRFEIMPADRMLVGAGQVECASPCRDADLSMDREARDVGAQQVPAR